MAARFSEFAQQIVSRSRADLLTLILEVSPFGLAFFVPMFLAATGLFIGEAGGFVNAYRVLGRAVRRNPLIPIFLLAILISFGVFVFYFFGGDWLGTMYIPLPGAMPERPSPPSAGAVRASHAVELSFFVFVISTLGYIIAMLLTLARPLREPRYPDYSPDFAGYQGYSDSDDSD